MIVEISQREFLERIPPGTRVLVSDLESEDRQGSIHARCPDIELHCPQCDGNRVFASAGSGPFIGAKKPFDTFLSYFCRNCRKAFKTFSYHATFVEASGKWEAFKYGEHPLFGPPTPARAITLIGPDRDLFLKGRRCENQGLGVGAFVYYRRVVENQKARIFDEIIRVSQHIQPDPQLISDLEQAKVEVQFTKAVAAIKHALPQSLLINGHNPLLLLHSALSEGVHEHSDSECLELASSVRVVLVEFAERLAQAMKDEAELSTAVNRLATSKKG